MQPLTIAVPPNKKNKPEAPKQHRARGCLKKTIRLIGMAAYWASHPTLKMLEKTSEMPEMPETPETPESHQIQETPDMIHPKARSWPRSELVRKIPRKR